LNRFGIPKSASFSFTMLAGQEASMDGQALFYRFARAVSCCRFDWGMSCNRAAKQFGVASAQPLTG
jgi:hypothetical protein